MSEESLISRGPSKGEFRKGRWLFLHPFAEMLYFKLKDGEDISKTHGHKSGVSKLSTRAFHPSRALSQYSREHAVPALVRQPELTPTPLFCSTSAPLPPGSLPSRPSSCLAQISDCMLSPPLTVHADCLMVCLDSTPKQRAGRCHLLSPSHLLARPATSPTLWEYL